MFKLTSNILLLVFLFTLGGFSCKLSKSSTNNDSHSLEQKIIQEAIKNNFNESDSLAILPNKDKNLTLYLSQTEITSANPITEISFFVFDKRANEIIYQNKFSNAQLEWYNNQQLLLTRYYGIINSEDKDNIKKFIIDLNSKEMQELKKRTNNQSTI